MKRIKLVLSIVAATAVMSMVGAPAMADVEIDSSGGSSGNGFTSFISSSSFGGSSDTFGFYSIDSDFDSLSFEGSYFDFD